MSLLENLPHTCTIYKVTRNKDSFGGGRDVSTAVQTGVSCWQQQASDSDQENFGKRGITNAKKIYFASDPGVNESHTISITHFKGVALANPIAFEVISQPLPDASAGLNVLWKVMVRDLSGRNE